VWPTSHRCEVAKFEVFDQTTHVFDHTTPVRKSLVSPLECAYRWIAPNSLMHCVPYNHGSQQFVCNLVSIDSIFPYKLSHFACMDFDVLA
jgi:hypothetical protein